MHASSEFASAVPSATPEPSEADLFALLARIERSNPSAAAAAISMEVDRLLRGAPPYPHTSTPPLRRSAASTDRRGASTAFGWYQAVVARTPGVLDPERTVEAAWWVEAGVFAEERLGGDELLPHHVEAQLREVALKGRAEFDLLVVSNLRLVFHWSKGVANSIGEDWIQDAFQTGCLGLIRGLQGWDYRRGYQLSTFVSWHIRQHIQRWRLNEIHLIRVPVHVWERLESDPDTLSPQVLKSARMALQIVSLDEDEAELDLRAHMHGDDFSDNLTILIERRQAVEELLGQLDERSADIVRLRQGLGPMGDEPLTLEVIGDLYGLTRERIRQIEKKAMDKLTILAHRASLAYLV